MMIKGFLFCLLLSSVLSSPFKKKLAHKKESFTRKDHHSHGRHYNHAHKEHIHKPHKSDDNSHWKKYTEVSESSTEQVHKNRFHDYEPLETKNTEVNENDIDNDVVDHKKHWNTQKKKTGGLESKPAYKLDSDGNNAEISEHSSQITPHHHKHQSSHKKVGHQHASDDAFDAQKENENILDEKPKKDGRYWTNGYPFNHHSKNPLPIQPLLKHKSYFGMPSQYHGINALIPQKELPNRMSETIPNDLAQYGHERQMNLIRPVNHNPAYFKSPNDYKVQLHMLGKKNHHPIYVKFNPLVKSHKALPFRQHANIPSTKTKHQGINLNSGNSVEIYARNLRENLLPNADQISSPFNATNDENMDDKGALYLIKNVDEEDLLANNDVKPKSDVKSAADFNKLMQEESLLHSNGQVKKTDIVEEMKENLIDEVLGGNGKPDAAVISPSQTSDTWHSELSSSVLTPSLQEIEIKEKMSSEGLVFITENDISSALDFVESTSLTNLAHTEEIEAVVAFPKSNKNEGNGMNKGNAEEYVTQEEIFDVATQGIQNEIHLTEEDISQWSTHNASEMVLVTEVFGSHGNITENEIESLAKEYLPEFLSSNKTSTEYEIPIEMVTVGSDTGKHPGVTQAETGIVMTEEQGDVAEKLISNVISGWSIHPENGTGTENGIFVITEQLSTETINANISAEHKISELMHSWPVEVQTEMGELTSPLFDETTNEEAQSIGNVIKDLILNSQNATGSDINENAKSELSVLENALLSTQSSNKDTMGDYVSNKINELEEDMHNQTSSEDTLTMMSSGQSGSQIYDEDENKKLIEEIFKNTENSILASTQNVLSDTYFASSKDTMIDNNLQITEENNIPKTVSLLNPSSDEKALDEIINDVEGKNLEIETTSLSLDELVNEAVISTENVNLLPDEILTEQSEKLDKENSKEEVDSQDTMIKMHSSQTKNGATTKNKTTTFVKEHRSEVYDGVIHETIISEKKEDTVEKKVFTAKIKDKSEPSLKKLHHREQHPKHFKGYLRLKPLRASNLKRLFQKHDGETSDRKRNEGLERIIEIPKRESEVTQYEKVLEDSNEVEFNRGKPKYESEQGNMETSLGSNGMNELYIVEGDSSTLASLRNLQLPRIQNQPKQEYRWKKANLGRVETTTPHSKQMKKNELTATQSPALAGRLLGDDSGMSKHLSEVPYSKNVIKAMNKPFNKKHNSLKTVSGNSIQSNKYYPKASVRGREKLKSKSMNDVSGLRMIRPASNKLEDENVQSMDSSEKLHHKNSFQNPQIRGSKQELHPGSSEYSSSIMPLKGHQNLVPDEENLGRDDYLSTFPSISKLPGRTNAKNTVFDDNHKVEAGHVIGDENKSHTHSNGSGNHVIAGSSNKINRISNHKIMIPRKKNANIMNKNPDHTETIPDKESSEDIDQIKNNKAIDINNKKTDFIIPNSNSSEAVSEIKGIPEKPEDETLDENADAERIANENLQNHHNLETEDASSTLKEEDVEDQRDIEEEMDGQDRSDAAANDHRMDKKSRHDQEDFSDDNDAIDMPKEMKTTSEKKRHHGHKHTESSRYDDHDLNENSADLDDSDDDSEALTNVATDEENAGISVIYVTMETTPESDFNDYVKVSNGSSGSIHRGGRSVSMGVDPAP